MGTLSREMFYSPDCDPRTSLRSKLDMIDTLAAMEFGRRMLDYMNESVEDIRKSINKELMIIIREVMDIMCDTSADDYTKVDKIVDVFNERGLSCSGCHEF